LDYDFEMSGKNSATHVPARGLRAISFSSLRSEPASDAMRVLLARNRRRELPVSRLKLPGHSPSRLDETHSDGVANQTGITVDSQLDHDPIPE